MAGGLPTRNKPREPRLSRAAACAAAGGLGLLTLAAGPLPGSLIQPVTSLVAQAVPATVEGTRLYSDAYLVVDGAKTYAVLDVYIKASQSTDIVASVYGVSAYKASWV
ncbi:MAG: hypothetical protein EBQ99_10865, partial [Planctomycetes bacterium]|nr:hypothetical protein [Planctomycetota bacterium]